MVTICLQCGDVGFTNAFVYCVNCLKYAVHRYCLPEKPKNLDEFVRWVCDDCEDYYDGRIGSMPQSVHENLCSTGDARMIVSPSRSYVNEDVSQRTHEPRRLLHNTVSEEDRELAKEEPIVSSTLSNGNEEVSWKRQKAGRYIVTTPIVGPSRWSLEVQPVVDPIWRGKFDIVNKNDEKFEGFVAHLSNRACQQAIDEAKLLPTLLQLEMVPKSTVWPKYFQTAPSDDNIALYILPEDTRYEKKFARLVDDMSRNELAMRAITKNAELLIFSSTELKMHYWSESHEKYSTFSASVSNYIKVLKKLLQDFRASIISGEFSKGRDPRSSETPKSHVNANHGHVNNAARY